MSAAGEDRTSAGVAGGQGPIARDVFVFGDLGILVESTEESHLVWLREFLTPHFELGPNAPHDCRVTLIEDPERHRAALALGAEGGTLDAFALDTSVVSLPRWNTAGTETRLFDPAFNVFYEMTDRRRAVTLVSTPGNLRARTALMRVVRELATNRAQQVGGVLLHASAFAVGGKGVAVAGPKLAGKTTLLIHALRAASARYVSNDRVLVPGKAGPAVLRGVPTIIALRPGTLGLFPWLTDRLAAMPCHHRLTLHEAATAEDPPRDRGNVSPAQFCRLLDTHPLADCQISALVFPCITHEPGTISVRRIPAAAAAAQLAGGLFGVPSGRWSSEVFAVGGDPPPPDLAALLDRCRDLTAQVACFECRLGQNAYEAPGSADDLIESLLG